MTTRTREVVCPCARCGAEQPYVEVTQFGDTRPRYIVTYECECPSPRCPFCRARTDDGWCWNLDCFLVGNIIPIPEVA